ADMASPMTALTLMKDCRRISDSFLVAEVNGPMPLSVPQTAMAEKIAIAAEVSLCGKRNAMSTRIGTVRNSSDSFGMIEWKRTPNTMRLTATSDVRRMTASRNRLLSHSIFGESVQRSSTGATMKSPDRSPSHHVYQTAPYDSGCVRPAASSVVTPTLALIA